MRNNLINLCLTALLSIVSTSAWALSQVNGIYQISSAADFNAFAALVNGGNTTACAELTTDINLGSSVTMIGTSDANGSRYEGTFDGKGHTISFSLTTTEQYSALFRYVGWCGIIQNLKVQGTVSTNSKFAGGLVAFNKGIIRDCYIDVTIDSTVSGDATHGGIVANGNSGTIIENCLAKIKILGSGTTNCGGVVGWASSPVNIVNCLVVSDGSTLNTSNGYSRNLGRNEGNVKVVDLSTYSANIYDNRPGGACYNNYVTNQWETSTHNLATTVVSTSNLADGKICYQLNNDQSRIAWVQRIGTDPFPVPAPFGTGRVYASGATGCNGQSASSLTYSNSGSDYATKHSFDKFGICSGCGCFNFHYFELDDPTKFDQTDRAVLLKNVTDIDMAEGMNRICNGFKLNMKMANDISYTAETGRYIFNASDWINGNFNGDGHTLTIEMVDVGNLAAFMPEHCGVFENVIMHGSISTNGTNVGSISGEARQSAVRNVYCDIDITSSINGDNTSGGLFGKMIYGKTVENVVYAGTFTTPRTDLTTGFVRIGGFAGWSNDAVTFRNCAFLGRLVGAGCANDTQTAGTENSYNISRNPSKITCVNVYVANPITSKYVKDDELSKFSTTTATEISSGGLCYKLNGSANDVERFYQTIGTDACPIPFSTSQMVHQASTGCYTNLPVSDGKVQIANGTNLAKFAKEVNAGNTGTNAVLTSYIDYTAYPEGFIGTDSKRYSGTFDGQNHTITTDIKTDVQGTGLFGSINNATIRNLVVEGNVESSQKWIGGLGGIARGDGTLIENVVVKSAVKFTGTGDSTCGGLFGDMEYAFTVRNCAFVGSINVGNSGENVGGLVSWTGSGTFTNCLVAPVEIIAKTQKDFIHGGAGTCSNCYKVAHNDARLASGELCYLLNGSTNDGTAWTQTIGTDANPIPFSTSQTVHQASTSCYTNLPVADGKVQIADGANLKKFAEEVNAGNTASNAVLTTDIDLDGVAWTPIGNGSYNYAGTFDGAGKAITNFSYTSTGDYNGLFGFINGATVKDFSIAGELTSNYAENGVVGWADGAAVVSGIHSSLDITVDCATHTGGVVGGSKAVNEAPLLVENCIYDGTLTSNNHADAQGGIIGYTYVGTVRNSLFNGTINGNVASKNYGGIIGYCKIANFGGIHNCLSIGKINAPSSTTAAAIIGNWNSEGDIVTKNITNNYYLLADGSTTDIAIGNKTSMVSEAPVLATTANLASGELCYLLNNGGANWYQTLGTDAHPTPDSSKPNVYEIAVSGAGYASFVPKANIKALPTGVTAYAGQKSGNYVHLEEVTGLPADNAVIVKAAEGKYYCNSTTESRSLGTSNDLTFSDTDFAATGTQYCLADGASGIGFYQVQSGIKIPARKAFLTVSAGSAGIKEFYGFEDDDATGLNDLRDSKDLKDFKDTIFNLAGQRTSKMQKGINIVNGKKVLR